MVEIVRIQDPEDPLVDIVHQLFAGEFGPEELDPIDTFREEIEQTNSGEHDAPYILLAVMAEDELIGGLAGNYFRLDNDAAAGAISYITVNKQRRRRGFGTAFVNEYLVCLNEHVVTEDRSLISVVVEVQTPTPKNPNFYDSRPFWDRLGGEFLKGQNTYNLLYLLRKMEFLI